MNKIIVCLLILTLCLNIYSKEKNILIEFGTGLSSAIGEIDNDNKFGFNFLFNTRYLFNKYFQVGLEYNRCRILIHTDGMDATAINSYLSKIYYTPLSGRIKPYISCGFGLVETISPRFKENSVTIFEYDDFKNFGYTSEIGIYIDKFKISTSFFYGGDFFNTALNKKQTIIFLQYNIGYYYSF